MNYIPANKVETGLYTSGGEYQDMLSQQEYVGSYYALYDGRIFAGLNILDNSMQLQAIKRIDENNLLASNYTRPNIDINQNNPRQIPTYSKHKPTASQYAKGNYLRYFLKKTNQTEYVEVDLATYTAVAQKTPTWVWEIYKPVTVVWSIVGNKMHTINQNTKNIFVVERENHIVGLYEYLKNNLSEFLLET